MFSNSFLRGSQGVPERMSGLLKCTLFGKLAFAGSAGGGPASGEMLCYPGRVRLLGAEPQNSLGTTWEYTWSCGQRR